MLGRKKPDETSPSPTPQAARSATAPATTATWSPTRTEAPTRAEASTRTEAPTRGETPSRGHMHIGKSVQIKGDLIANEEMTIDGAVDGNIVIENHQLTVGTNGRITATVRVKSIVVLGKVVGNITAEDRVEVKNGGTVEGDIRGPRVILADGAVFKGTVDMVVPAGEGARAAKAEKGAPAAEAGSVAPQPAVDDMPALFTESSDEVPATDGARKSSRLAEKF